MKHSSVKLKACGQVLLILIAVIYVSDSLLNFILRHSVNLPFSDQWDLLFTPVPIDQRSFSSLFFHQHGPHYQGLSFIFDSLMCRFTSWNIRYTSIMTGVWLILAGIAALGLSKKVSGSLCIALASFLLVCSKNFHETILITNNASHSIFATFLLFVLISNSLDLERKIKLIFHCLLTWLIAFSGFGLVYLLLEPINLYFLKLHKVKRQFLAVIGLNYLAILCVFLSFYRSVEAFPGSKLSIFEKISAILDFIIALLGSFWFSNEVYKTFLGYLSLFALILIVIHLASTLFKEKNTNNAIKYSRFLLLTFWSVGLLIICAYGRADWGTYNAGASRYMIFSAPLWFVFLNIFPLNNLYKLIPGLLALILVTSNSLVIRPEELNLIRGFKKTKRTFIQRYISTGNFEASKAQLPFLELGMTENRLLHLKQHKLAIFKKKL